MPKLIPIAQKIKDFVRYSVAARLVILALLFPNGLLASQAFEANDRIVAEIKIVGLRRTHPDVVHRELLIKEGDLFQRELAEESMQRLRNMGLFATSHYDFVGHTLVVNLEERWTTIPIAKFQSGGGDRELILGAFDINFLGQYLEVGGQYERLNDTNSGVVWYRDPRLFNQRLELFVNLWNVNRKQLLYDQEVRDTREQASYFMERRKANIVLKREWDWWLRTGLILDYNDDHFRQFHLIDANAAPDEILLEGDLIPSEVLLTGFSLELGRLDFDSFLVDGLEWQVELLHSNVDLVSTHGFTLLSTRVRYFRTLPLRSTVGFNFSLGVSDAELIQYHQFLGGLDTVRGFPASRFHAANYWRTNVEFRIPSFDTPWFVVQHVLFSDTTSLAQKTKDLRPDATASSVGLGLRLISPRVYRFVGRLDYAVAVLGKAEEPISFGVQQFF